MLFLRLLGTVFTLKIWYFCSSGTHVDFSLIINTRVTKCPDKPSPVLIGWRWLHDKLTTILNIGLHLVAVESPMCLRVFA